MVAQCDEGVYQWPAVTIPAASPRPSHRSCTTDRVSGLDQLTPAQQRTLGLLRRGDEPVMFSREFVEDLCAEVGEALDGFGKRLADSGDTLWVSKHMVASVHGCEVQYLTDEPFTWSPAVAGGQVAHRAIELLVNWRGEPVPGELVDEAIERLAESE